jgi:hypothetical protein
VTAVEHGPPAGDYRTITGIAAVVTILGILMAIAGLINLAQTPQMRAVASHRAGSVDLNPLQQPFNLITLIFVVTQNWLTIVLVQFAFAALTLTIGVGLYRRRPWSRASLEGLGWAGAMLLAVPVVWVARWMIAAPTAPLTGLLAGLQTLPSGQPVAFLLLLLVAAPLPLLALLPIGAFIGTVASVAVPIACVILIVLLRRSREAFYHGERDTGA